MSNDLKPKVKECQATGWEKVHGLFGREVVADYIGDSKKARREALQSVVCGRFEVEDTEIQYVSCCCSLM